MEINYERKNKIKFNNLKITKYFKIISKDKFKFKVRAILELQLIIWCDVGFV